MSHDGESLMEIIVHHAEAEMESDTGNYNRKEIKKDPGPCCLLAPNETCLEILTGRPPEKQTTRLFCVPCATPKILFPALS